MTKITSEELKRIIEIETPFYIATGHPMQFEKDLKQEPDKVWRAWDKANWNRMFYASNLDELDLKVQQFIYKHRGIPVGEIRNYSNKLINDYIDKREWIT